MQNVVDPTFTRMEDWRAKILKTGHPSSERLGNLTLRSLEVLNSALKDGFTSQNFQCALETLQSDWVITMKYDANRDAPLRQMIYAMADSIHFTFLSMSSGSPRTPELIAPKEEFEIMEPDSLLLPQYIPPSEQPSQLILPKETKRNKWDMRTRILLESVDDLSKEAKAPPKTSFLPPGKTSYEQDLKLFTPDFDCKSEPPEEPTFDMPSTSSSQQYHTFIKEESPVSAFPPSRRQLLESNPELKEAVLREQQEALALARSRQLSETMLVCPLCKHLSNKATGLQSHFRRAHDGVTMNELGIGLSCECGRNFNAFFALFKHNQKGCTGVLTMFNREDHPSPTDNCQPMSTMKDYAQTQGTLTRSKAFD